MKLIDLLISARQGVLQLLDDTRSSSGSLFGWDRTRPNVGTKSRIDTLVLQHIEAARAFGIHLVTRHSPCGAVSHRSQDYWMESAELDVKTYQDDRFDWTGIQLYQGSRACTCPCSPQARPKAHHVIDEFVVQKGRATRRHVLFAEALERIRAAGEASTDRSARSTLREGLLRAVLTLNDGILPQSVDDYIAASDIGSAAPLQPAGG